MPPPRQQYPEISVSQAQLSGGLSFFSTAIFQNGWCEWDSSRHLYWVEVWGFDFATLPPANKDVSSFTIRTCSSSLSREYWGVPSLGGLDTWRCRESPFPRVSRHNTKATLSCSRLESIVERRERYNKMEKILNSKKWNKYVKTKNEKKINPSKTINVHIYNSDTATSCTNHYFVLYQRKQIAVPVWSRLSSSQRLVPW